jgi:membrane-associated protein
MGVIAVIFAESGLFIGFFLPGDSLLFTAGLVASQGLMNPAFLFFGCFLAAVIGDSVGYAFGKRVGPKLFSKPDSFLFSQKHIDRSKAFFAKHGKKAIILARFTPIVRTFTPILAGVGSMDYSLFIIYNILGGLLWTGTMVAGGYWFGMLIPNPDRYILPIIVVIILTSFIPSLISIWRNKK